MTWRELSDEISAKTEVRLSDEVLRQIVHQPRQRFRTLNADTRRALIAVCLDPLLRGSGTGPGRVRYTGRQIEVLRSLMEGYYKVQKDGPREATWGGICDEIEDKTGVLMDEEVLRQWVERAKRRSKFRIPGNKNLKAIASFLMHKEIALIDKEELEELGELRIPYLLARQLLRCLNREIALIEPPQSS